MLYRHPSLASRSGIFRQRLAANPKSYPGGEHDYICYKVTKTSLAKETGQKTRQTATAISEEFRKNSNGIFSRGTNRANAVYFQRLVTDAKAGRGDLRGHRRHDG